MNADDPEACIEVARLTAAYRATFKRDTLIDLVGYRRYGHNEGDEPSFTQPAMYKIIAALPTVREKWAHTLVARGVVSDAQAAEMVAKQQTALEQALETVQRNAQPTGAVSGAAAPRRRAPGQDGRAVRAAAGAERGPDARPAGLHDPQEAGAHPRQASRGA